MPPIGDIEKIDPTPIPIPTPVSDWRESLPPELKAEKSLESIKDLPSLARGYVAAQKYVGGAVRIPGTDAKPEEWSEFYGKLGRPGKPEEYGIGRPADLPKGMEWDDSLSTDFTKAAHEAGLTKGQAEKLVTWYGKTIASSTQAGLTTMEEAETELRASWGGAYEKNVGIANRALRTLGGQDLAAKIVASGLGNDPAFIRLFAKIGHEMAESGAIAGDIEGVTGTEDAKRKIAEIMGDRKHPYWVGDHPQHRQSVDEIQALHQLVYSQP